MQVKVFGSPAHHQTALYSIGQFFSAALGTVSTDHLDYKVAK
jgi:hypothetical protein